MTKSIYIFIVLIFSSYAFKAQSFALSDTSFQEGDVMISYDVIFDYDKATIRPESYPFLDSLVAFMNSNPTLKLGIYNHCDERFSEMYSTCLTCKRAKAIADYLINHGINVDRLNPKGFNDHQPLIVNAQSEEEHLKNRRTEYVILEF